MPRHTITITGEDGKNAAFSLDDHHDLFELLSRARNEAETRAIVGVRLFGNILLEHKDEPLYAGLAREFGPFMRELKKTALSDSASPKQD